jgi:lipoprotein NlpD
MREISSIYIKSYPYMFIILIAVMPLISCIAHKPSPVGPRMASAQAPVTYVVVPGDTLFGIAWRHGLKYDELARFNAIAPPFIIRPGQVIRLNGRVRTKPINVKKAGEKVLQVGSGRASSNHDRQLNKTPVKYSKDPKFGSKIAPIWRWPSSGALLLSFQGANGLSKGIDLAGKLGEPVMAAAAGQVVYAGSGLRGYGKLLIIKHSEMFLSAYAHNDNLLVKEGDLVKVGQRIADMGSTGTDRVKLHFEIRRDGTPVDPLSYLPRR